VGRTSHSHLASHLGFGPVNGRVETLNVGTLWSTDILTKVLDIAGGDFWPSWKAARLEQGLPVLDRAEPRESTKVTSTNPFKQRAEKKPQADLVPSPPVEESIVDTSKTGAARILP